MKYEIEPAAAPVISSGATTDPVTWLDARTRGKFAPVQLRVAFANWTRTKENGEFLTEHVREFVKRLRRRNDERSIRERRRMVVFAPTLTFGIAEFLEYLG